MLFHKRKRKDYKSLLEEYRQELEGSISSYTYLSLNKSKVQAFDLTNEQKIHQEELIDRSLKRLQDRITYLQSKVEKYETKVGCKK